MIFGKQYDESLFIMMAGDKKNRGKILEFVKSIPEELHQQIKEAIDKYMEYEKTDIELLDGEDFFINGSYLDGDNFRYWFNIDMLIGSLTIGKCFQTDNGYIRVIEISLLRGGNYDALSIGGKQWIGNVVDDFKENGYVTSFEDLLYRYNEFGYTLVNNRMGVSLKYARGNVPVLKNVSKGIDLCNIPSDIIMFDLSDGDRLNGLVRKRGKNKR